MSTTELTLPLICAQVEAIRKKVPGATIFGIHSPSRWLGESVNSVGEETFLIRQCDSPLAMRMALREEISDVSTRVLVTSLHDHELGDELCLRLTKRRLFAFDRWGVVKTLFQAKGVDPRLSSHAWMADTLLEVWQKGEFAPVAGGFLDAETAWNILLERLIGLKDRRPDLHIVLRWTTNASAVDRFTKTSDDFRSAATDWLEQFCGPTVRAVLQCVTTNTTDAIPLGLVLGVLLHPAAPSDAAAALVRVEERFLGQQKVDPAWALPWAKAADEVARSMIIETQSLPPEAKRADDILKDVEAAHLAHLSDLSPTGLVQRLGQFGDELSELISNSQFSTVVPLVKCRDRIHAHADVGKDARQLERIDMAIRLVQWLGERTTRESPAKDLPQAARGYLDDGSFADWARLTLRTADPLGSLDQAYKTLGKLVAESRDKNSETFATMLKDWTSADSKADAVVAVEEILARVVAPLAESTPVLVILLDGMSGAVFHELVADISGSDWMSICPADRGDLAVGLATLPSLTAAARTSFFCGELRTGNSTIEKKEFAKHPVLKPLTDGGKPPVLFHKAELVDDKSNLAIEVRETILSKNHRIVAVVVNAVDAHLTNSDQVDMPWTKSSINPLGGLLLEANQAGRCVVLVSDHGHVLDLGTRMLSAPDGSGERYRSATGELSEGEMEISGRRVLMPPGGTLVAPWTEMIRYSSKKNGYHGGFSLQEMVIPIGVLCPDDELPEGWSEARVTTPTWWDTPFAASAGEALPPLKIKRAEPKPPPGRLFPVEEVSETGDGDQMVEWLTALLESDIFEAQKTLAGRQIPSNEVIEKIVGTLDGNGGKMTIQGLARATEYPPVRLRGLVAVLQRILNVDGFSVLRRDDATQTIELNRELLLQQFALMDS